MNYKITSNTLTFDITREQALELSNKSETHDIRYTIDDKRTKSYDQIKLFWSLLNEFVEFLFPNQKSNKSDLEKIKLSLYNDYANDKKVNIRLSKTNVTNARLFIDWVITKFADDYNYIPQSIHLQKEFNSSYVYSTLIANKCAVCGLNGQVNNKGDKYISLCDNHKDLSTKQLINKYYLERIKLSSKTLEIINERITNETL